MKKKKFKTFKSLFKNLLKHWYKVSQIYKKQRTWELTHEIIENCHQTFSSLLFYVITFTKIIGFIASEIYIIFSGSYVYKAQL
jgi:hypothetical protein